MTRPAFLDDPALAAVWDSLPGARVVGGAVRDALSGRDVADVDLATTLPPDAVVRALTAAGLKHAPTGLAHGTVTAIGHGRGFEVTTLRRDETTDGRHAQVAWTDDWQEDAARRDFTINAMSMERDGTLHDYFDGQADLLAGRLRFVGDPRRRIAEDYLRILRFFRFHARYAMEPPDDTTETALRNGVPGVARLSVERVWSEIKRILLLPDPAPTLRLMQRLGVLDAVLPGGTDPEAVARLIAAGAPGDPMLRLAALQAGIGAAARFKLSNADLSALRGLDGPAPDPAWDDDGLRRVLADVPNEVLAGRSWLSGGADPAQAAMRARLAAMRRPVFPMQGRDAVALGVPAGPRVGALLDRVRRWWLAGGCRAGAEACRAELARLAQG